MQPANETFPSYEPEVEEAALSSRFLRWLKDWRVLVALGLALLVIAAIVAGPRVYKAAKAWRAGQFIDEAARAQSIGDSAGETGALRRALLLAPDDETVRRAVVCADAAHGGPAALRALKDLIDRGAATPEELLVFATAAIRSGLLAEARGALTRLPEALPDHMKPRHARTTIELAAAEGRIEEAISMARQSTLATAGDVCDEMRLLLAQLLLGPQGHGDATERKREARALLDTLGAAPTPRGLHALRILAEIGPKEKAVIEGLAVVGRLREHPRHTPDDALLAASVELLEQPAERQRIIAKLAAGRAKASDADQLAFARWLNGRAAFEQVLAFAGAERARRDDDWLLVYADALAGLHRWQDVRQLLEEARPPGLDEAIRHLFLARAATEAGDPAAADQHWRDVHRFLRLEKTETVLYVARYAERIGVREQAIAAYRRLTDRKEAALEGFLGLLRCQPPNAAAADLLAIYDDFVQQYPDLTEVQNDQAYLRLLCQREVEQASATGRRLRERFPDMPAFLTTAALGELRQGNAAAAEALYVGRPVAWNAAPDSWKAVRVAVLEARGRLTEAAALKAGINLSRLRPEERQLLGGGP